MSELPPQGLQLCSGDEWKTITYRPRAASKGETSHIVRGLALTTPDAVIIALVLILSLSTGAALPGDPYFALGTSAELTAQAWARHGVVNGTDQARAGMRAFIDESVGLASLSQIGQAMTTAALAMAGLHAASSWGGLEPWLRSKVVVLVLLVLASLGVLSAPHLLTPLSAGRGTCLILEASPIFGMLFQIAAALYTASAYTDSNVWRSAKQPKQRRCGLLRCSHGTRQQQLTAVVMGAIVLIGWGLVVMSAHLQPTRATADTTFIGTLAITIAVLLALTRTCCSWQARLAAAAKAAAASRSGKPGSGALPPGGAGCLSCSCCRRGPAGPVPCSLPSRTNIVSLLQLALPFLILAICLGSFGLLETSGGCPPWLQAGRSDDLAAATRPPAGTTWPGGFDASSGVASSNVLGVLTSTSVLHLLTALVTASISITIILQAQDSAARVREREGQEASETLRRAIGHVSHGARGPLNAAVLSLALLRQLKESGPDTTGASSHPPVGGTTVGAGSSTGGRATTAEAAAADDAAADEAAADTDQSDTPNARDRPRPPGRPAQPPLLDRGALLKELRASIQDSKQQLDGLLLWEKTKDRAAVDAVPWVWSPLNKRWRQRIRLAFHGLCEAGSVFLRVTSAAPSRDVWSDLNRPSPAGAGDVTAGTTRPMGLAETLAAEASSATAAPSTRDGTAALVRIEAAAGGSALPSPLPPVRPPRSSDLFAVFADQDRIIGVCNNAVAHALSRVSDTENAKVELRCSVVPDADLCLRLGGPLQHPAEGDTSLLLSRWLRDDDDDLPAAADASAVTIADASRGGRRRSSVRHRRSQSGDRRRVGAAPATWGAGRHRSNSQSNGTPTSAVAHSRSRSRSGHASTVSGAVPPSLGVLQIEVRDNGRGIAPALLRSGKLFQPFARLHADDGGLRIGSTGLALAVVRAIVVEGMGGEVGLSSRPPAPDRPPVPGAPGGAASPRQDRTGAVLYARIPVWLRPNAENEPQAVRSSAGDALPAGSDAHLPAPMPAPATAATAAPPVPPPGRVPRAGPDAAAAAAAAAGGSGSEASGVERGAAALKHPPKAGRGAGSAGGTLSSDVTAPPAERSSASPPPPSVAGLSPAPVGPILPGKLPPIRRDRAAKPSGGREARQGRRAERDAARSGRARPKAKAHPLAGKLVFICDDDTTMSALVGRVLRRKGLTSRCFCDGRQLMDHMKGLMDGAPEPWPDAVLVDGRMPRLDGKGVLRERGELVAGGAARLGATPFIMLTGEASMGGTFDRLGCAGTLVKPADADAILSMLMTVIPAAVAEDSPSPAAPTS